MLNQRARHGAGPTSERSFRNRVSLGLCLFAFSLALTIARADPAPGEQKFLKVPGARLITPVSELEVIKDLPAALAPELLHFDWGDGENHPPAEVRGFAWDLNKDERKEYFIENSSQSGSFGLTFRVFSEINGHWQFIGEFQGAIYVFRAKKGWPRLVTIGRGGAATFSKTYSEFSDGKYHDTMVERYEQGRITKESVQE
jgi:hypothetical protein